MRCKGPKTIILLALLSTVFGAQRREIIHKNCFFEPEFNVKFAANLDEQPLRRLFRHSAKQLGEGGFGKVHEIQWIEKGKSRPLAVKLFVIHDSEDEASVKREIEALYALRENPYVVRIAGCVETMVKQRRNKYVEQRAVYILTERLFEDLDDKGPASKRINVFREKYSNERRLQFYLKLAQAVESLHEAGYVHSDLKPGNVMTTDRDFSGVKIVDFGLSNKVGGQYVGTTDLFAPPEYEFVTSLEFPFDVYMYGATLGAIEGPAGNLERRAEHLWCAECADLRFKMIERQVNHHFLFGFRDKPKSKNGDHIVKLVYDCMNPYPGDRPTAAQVTQRMRQITKDKRQYMITPQNRLRHTLFDMTMENGKRVLKKFSEEFVFYRELPKVPTLNTKFGIQPEVNVAAAPLLSKINIQGEHLTQSRKSMFKSDFFKSQLIEEEQQFNWASPWVWIGGVVALLTISVVILMAV